MVVWKDYLFIYLSNDGGTKVWSNKRVCAGSQKLCWKQIGNSIHKLEVLSFTPLSGDKMAIDIYKSSPGSPILSVKLMSGQSIRRRIWYTPHYPFGELIEIL